MLHMLPVWLLAAAFFGAGLFNAAGTASTRESFMRWGYPWWWCRVTGALEITVAALLLLPAARAAALLLGTAIVAVAALTILRRREWSHLPPLGLFAVLIALAGAMA